MKNLLFLIVLHFSVASTIYGQMHISTSYIQVVELNISTGKLVVLAEDVGTNFFEYSSNMTLLSHTNGAGGIEVFKIKWHNLDYLEDYNNHLHTVVVSDEGISYLISYDINDSFLVFSKHDNEANDWLPIVRYGIKRVWFDD